jgi:hypothetical protein
MSGKPKAFRYLLLALCDVAFMCLAVAAIILALWMWLQ